MATLSKLPNELLVQIGVQARITFRGLATLTRVSKRFHSIYNTTLYKRCVASKSKRLFVTVWAAANGHPRVFGYLAAAGFDAMTTEIRVDSTKWQCRPLRNLLESLNIRRRDRRPGYDHCNQTFYAIHIAVLAGQLTTVKELQKAGASPRWKSRGIKKAEHELDGGFLWSDWSACALAIEMQNLEMFKIIWDGHVNWDDAEPAVKSSKQDLNELHVAALTHSIKLMRYIVEGDGTGTQVSIDLPTRGGQTALHLACTHEDMKSSAEAVHELLELGADPHIRASDIDQPRAKGIKSRWTIMLKAIHYHNFPVINVLLKHGVEMPDKVPLSLSYSMPVFHWL